ncbi:Disease resistance protein RPS5 [Vitis vinifera]|uniref:Disease resistance protein RPS5 n=1 Tax=Vitis vinifera TaxID=29760 RepID=A0A438GXX9_VITVI|nr:Disease resistance protein RPS5 [Vitis vinifera]
MDCVSPIFTVATFLWNCTAPRASIIRDLLTNLESLGNEMELLNFRSEDVKTRVELEKQQQLIPRREVEGWLQEVGDVQNEVNAILEEGGLVPEKKCLGNCYNIRSSYNLGKRVTRTLSHVRELTRRGDFEVVAYRLPRAVVDELPLGPTVGLDSLCERVCSCLDEDEVGIVGLYGMRGVGKTTLMKKINNHFLKTRHEFDTVIWVAVFNEASVTAVQEVIGNKLQIVDSVWQNKSQTEKAIEIFNIMKTKRFLLLFDDVCRRLDLSQIGVPVPDVGNRSKDLFMEMVGKDTVGSHAEIENLAGSVVERCGGLPLALVTAGRALADKSTPWEWEQEIQKLTNFLKEISDYRMIPGTRLYEMPPEPTVGLDTLHETVCRRLTDNKVGIVGLYGTGGVGKTTLMKKINNELVKTKYQFHIVIWVAVSKQASVAAAQEVIRNRLQIPDSMWQNRTQNEKAIEIFNIMKTERFLLLLDDVWKVLDLSQIGVPLPDDRNRSKVIITTRLWRICIEMGAQLKFRVQCLAWKEALTLFQKNVGENTLNSHPDIARLSEKVAGLCKGLPLALVTVGRAMADKNSPQEWDQAIQELEKFPAEISGMEDGLFHILKLSYDSLKDEITRSCFIYCSVFPKEYEIRSDELIEHWIGEGFFDGKDIYEARRRGYKIIEDLKNACLLEEGDGFKESIKMHDVIRDMALWIGQECGKKMNKILVCESLGLVEAERVTNWKEAERISLWGWNIEKLAKTPHCSNLQTLFVRECIQLKTFPTGFFQFMPLIRVLDLSATHCLIKLPDGVDRLMNLEYINLSMTHIGELPVGMTKLTKLRCLLLDGMPALIIPPHLISTLSSLQLFSMYDGNALSSFRTTLLEELESIDTMDELSLSFRSVVALNKLLTSYKLQEMKINVEKEGSQGFEQSYDIPKPELIVRNNHHFRRLRDVKIWSCPKLLNLTWLIYAACLESLNVQFCESMKEVISNECLTSSTQHASVFTRLTSLVLGGIECVARALLFPSLEVISVINCPRLRRLPFDSNSAIKSLKKIEGDQTWWESLEWKDESVVAIFTNYFSPQYLADPIHPSEEPTHRKVSLAQNRESGGKEETGGRRLKLKSSHLNTASQAHKLKLMREQVPLVHSLISCASIKT